MTTKTKHRTSAEIIENSLRPHCEWEMTRYLQAVALDAARAKAVAEVEAQFATA